MNNKFNLQILLISLIILSFSGIFSLEVENDLKINNIKNNNEEE